ncbi:MAG: hypothetical protein JW395_3071 [Nitrospira sp.]|nr:hypothetical protein [Nitrospira sp.]
MIIRNKAEFFRLWEAGVLGNRTNLWHDPQEAYDSGAPQIGFRQIGSAGGGAWERVDRKDVFECAGRWQKAGRIFIMDDGCPDEKRTLQGEVCRTERGMEGFLDVRSILPMRQAIAQGHMRHTTYAVTRALLVKFMDPSSRDDLDALLDLYPDASIEFTCFSVNVGVFPGRNTLFWETRNY